MLPKDFIEYIAKMTSEDNDTLSPAEKLMLLGIDPFSFCRRKKKRKTTNIDEDEYNDDFATEDEYDDEEPYDDYNRYIYEEDEYDMAQLKEFPFLRAVLLYNNNKRKYYA